MSVLEAAFADPVLDAQSSFRALMEALARPGTRQPVGFDGAPPAPLTPELAALALTLCDNDTPAWLDPELAASEAVRAWLAFHTGAPVTGAPQDAAFALATRAETLPSFGRFNQGTDEYPDRSTTILLAVPALGGGTPITCRGPGIEAEATIAPLGLPGDILAQWAGNKMLFPRGVDLVLAAPGEVLGLPRTTRLEG